MDLPVNGFKRALAARRPQIGFWCTLPGGYAAEILAGAGFDWLLFDTEHSPADPITVLAQLQAAAPYRVASVVRAAWNDTVLIKRFLDVGAQSLLIPYVQIGGGGAGGGGGDPLSAARDARRQQHEPRHAVRADRRLPARGRRPSSACWCRSRPSRRWTRSRRSPRSTASTASSSGPATWPRASTMPAISAHPEVVAAVEGAITRIARAGKPAGILTPDRAFARRCLELGALFVAVGLDAALLARGAEALAREFKG